MRVGGGEGGWEEGKVGVDGGECEVRGRWEENSDLVTQHL